MLLSQWEARLRQWAGEGRLVAAATDALRLAEKPEPLEDLAAFADLLAQGDTSALPPVRVLSGAAMPSARGAYAQSTGTIYLNGAWLATASDQDALAVLTEELGHHLDGPLNATDTPGDEGELFAALLQGEGVIGDERRQTLEAENDMGYAWVSEQHLEVEQATFITLQVSTAYTQENESSPLVFTFTRDSVTRKRCVRHRIDRIFSNQRQRN
jgi:hypothetical protein